MNNFVAQGDIKFVEVQGIVNTIQAEQEHKKDILCIDSKKDANMEGNNLDGCSPSIPRKN